ncbi:hypothetical protein A6A40_14600 [Azospirillum humicireducens]|uniref:Uncharacterized protein n=1 Tax=Azospirillum humicireducens TaxID=1226968 RepID=A0A2R4VPJ0_9PROT|nr:hypothetical protein A6A40_14600 [Azospirillum humicireducens]
MHITMQLPIGEGAMSQVGKMDACASKRCGNITPNVKAVEVRGGCRRHEDDQEHWRKVAAAWNSFDEKHGCFADEWNREFMSEDAQGR